MPSAGRPLSVSDLTVRLGGREVVENVSLHLAPGDLLWLTGGNGAGKSTLLRALVGLLPSSGTVRIDGHPPGTLAARASSVFVPDEPALYEDLTLREHAEFVSRVYGRPEARTGMLSWLDRFDLSAVLDEFPAHHSRGMRQKLSLSLALGLALPLTLLDEPFNGLDAEAQRALSDGLTDLTHAGGAVVLSAHQGDLGADLLPHARRGRRGQLRGGVYTEDLAVPAGLPS